MASTLPDVIDEEFLCCPLCLCSFTEPKILPCLHTFCLACLEGHVTRTEVDLKFTCPQCDVSFSTPERGVKGLKTNSFAASLQEVVTSQSGGPKNCTNCETASARFRCLDCHNFLCSGCRDAHQWVKVTRGHRVMTLGELQSGKYQGELQRRQPVTCDLHRKHELILICVTCDRAICSECKVTAHQDHRSGSLHEAANRDRYLLQSLSDSVKSQQKMFEASLSSLDQYNKQCNMEKQKLLDSLVEQKQLLHDLIDSCHSELIQQVETVFSEEETNKEGQRSQIEQTIQTMNHQCDFTEKLLKHGKDGDIMTMGKLLKINLNNYSFAIPPELDERLVVQYSPASIHKGRVLPLFGKIIKKRNVAVKQTNHRTVAMEEAMHRGRFAPRLLCTFRSKTNYDTKGCKPTGVALSADDDIVIVDDINKKIKVFHQTGELKADICPEGPCALIDPWDVVVTKEGHYAVTDKGARNVKIYSTNGNFLRTFGSSLKCPWGITCNSKGDLIITDPAAKAVFVYDSDGNLLFQLDCHNQNNLFMCPEYVAVNGNDDIIVSDFDKHCITVFDSQGRFLYRYGTRGKGLHEFHVPCGVCTDQEGNILVVDYNNQRVHLLSEDGQFLCFLATKEDGLMTPQTAVVNSKGHLVVVDGTNIKIFAFPMDSERRDSDGFNFFNVMYEGVTFEEDSGPSETEI